LIRKFDFDLALRMTHQHDGIVVKNLTRGYGKFKVLDDLSMNVKMKKKKKIMC